MHTTLGSVAFALSLAGGAVTLTAAPIEDLSGYWSGSGSVTLSNGRTESVKCAVTYKVSDGGGQVRQSMRCASADYSINALAELQIKGSQVSGSWEEKTYSATGVVTGRYTGSNFVLSIEGANFTAAMNMSVSDCKQSISIAPAGPRSLKNLHRPGQMLGCVPRQRFCWAESPSVATAPRCWRDQPSPGCRRIGNLRQDPCW